MERKIRVVLDTNIFISALGFGGKPRQILFLVLDKKINVVSSPILLAEFDDVVSKKFPILVSKLKKIHRQLEKNMTIIKPKLSLHILEDEPDNRVLEAAIEGKCGFIVTGDNDLLNLKKFKNVSIVKPEDFLNSLQI